MDIAQETQARSGRWDFRSVFTSVIADLRDEIALQKPQLFLWSPVFLACGIGLYFSLPTEPPFVLSFFAVVAALALAVITAGRQAGPLVMLLIFLPCLGFVAAQARTYIAHTPILQDEINFAHVAGTVEAIEDLGAAEGSRVILRELRIEDLDASKTPRKLRLRVRSDHGLRVGQPIEVLASLNPPSPPVMPGSFDFQRHLYFQGIGGIGFVYKEVPAPAPLPARHLLNFVETLRHNIALGVEEHLEHPAAGIAVALLNGRMHGISKADQDAMRDSGLFHMLSISGLHVGLLCGVVFFFSRLCMVMIPGCALRWPVKKFASVIAMIAAVCYMALAGAPIPTQRAVLMSGLFFLAIILDRSPFSLRTIAFAAFCVLLFFPESLLSVSFQMSFAAVAALIWFFEKISPVLSPWYRQAGAIKRAALYFIGVCLTTIIASAATAPFGLFHFQNFALAGTVANLIAGPLMAFIIMPGVVAVLFLMPLGLEALPLYFMGKGIDAVLHVAYWAAALPYATIAVRAWPFPALLCLVTAGLFGALWRGHLRVYALVPLALAALLIADHRLPDILISSDYDVVAYHDTQGLHVSTRRRAKFTQEKWAQAYALTPEDLLVWPREGRAGAMLCGEEACRISLKGYTISYTEDEAVLAGECGQADIVLSAIPARGCRAGVVVDLFDVKDRGAHALWLEAGGARVQSAEALRGQRPWSGLNDDF